jgi:arylsulfatase A-like enzyme/Flp pilus assembly protein TadD
MQSFVRVLLVILLAQSLSAAQSKPANRRPASSAKPSNIILITLDTTRADRMGFLGSTRGLTPNLDALAQQSAIFTRAYAQVPLTTPSHAALLTGTYPQFNHLEDLGMPLGNELPYLPDLLHQHGYQTAAFLGANILDAKGGMASGFDRGFDLYDTDFHDPRPGEDRYHNVERRAGDVADRALKWLGKHQQGPFFMWLHFYDPHDPYDPPAPFKERYAKEPYDGEIAYVDSVVGSFIEELRKRGLYQHALIAITADHGEAFGEHGEERHGMFLYDETIRVPLLLKLPEQKFAGKRIDPRVALVDIPPSLLKVAGIAAPASMQGQSLFPLLEASESAVDENEKEKEKVPDRAIFASSSYARRIFGASELRSWRSGKYLYVQAPRRELYDEPLDPGANKNLATSAKAVADTLDTQLSGFLQKTSSAQTRNAKLDPAVVEKLRALGYLATESTTPKNSDKADVDPKDKVDVANRYHRALVKGEEGHYAEQIADLREIVAHDPDVPGADFNLGSALVNVGEYGEALPFLHKAADSFPESAAPHYELALALSALSRLGEALKEMQAASICVPGSANLHNLVAGLHVQLQQMPAAIKEYEKAIQLDPNHFDANLGYGRLLFSQGRHNAALPKLLRAAKLNPDSMDAHMSLADVYTQLGEDDKAAGELAVYQRLLRAANRPAADKP